MSDSASTVTHIRAAVDDLRLTRRALFLDASSQLTEQQIETFRQRLNQAAAELANDVCWRDTQALLPKELQPILQDLRHIAAELEDVFQDAEARNAYSKWLDDRARILRSVVYARAAAGHSADLDAQAAAISTIASASGRPLTLREIDRQDTLRAQARDAKKASQELEGLRSDSERKSALELLATSRVKIARQQLESGLVLTRQMRDIIAESVPSLKQGEPMLLLGETGGAKTALARYLSTEFLGGSSEIVSGFADMTAGQLMGTYELRVTQGATQSVFVDGPLTRAIAEGKPIIIDEINALPPEFLKRLNLILQLRPGDEYRLQEHAGRVITVAQGFVVLATANEHTPNRYRGLERLSAELTNRFGANSYRVKYPDSATAYDELPRENTLLAYAAVVGNDGQLPPTIDASSVERAARAAFVSQQVFAGSHGEGFDQYRSAEHRIDGRPGLEETVLAPRTLVAVLHKASRSAGAVSIERAMERFIDSIMHPEDREVHRLILQSQGLVN